MKLKSFVIGVLFLFSACLFCVNAKVIKGKPFHSNILNQEINYTVYLPENYDNTKEKYPVIYLLHGLFSNDAEWFNTGGGNIDEVMNNAIKEGKIKPCICIAPFADKTKYYYINSFDGKGKWEDMFNQEFIPTVEKEYKIESDKYHRGIAGISMGGYGALLHVMKYPDMYSACAAFAPGIRTDEQIPALSQNNYNVRYGHPFGWDLKGKDRLTDYYKKYDILRMVNLIPATQISKVKLYINCGDVDIFTIGSCLLHIELTKNKIPHVYNMGSGGHEWKYWKQYEVDGLKFISDSFK